MYHISKETLRAAENAKILKQQIMAALKSIPGLTEEWLATAQAFLDNVGADVVIGNIMKQETVIPHFWRQRSLASLLAL